MGGVGVRGRGQGGCERRFEVFVKKKILGGGVGGGEGSGGVNGRGRVGVGGQGG